MSWRLEELIPVLVAIQGKPPPECKEWFVERTQAHKERLAAEAAAAESKQAKAELRSSRSDKCLDPFFPQPIYSEPCRHEVL